MMFRHWRAAAIDHQGHPSKQQVTKMTRNPMKEFAKKVSMASCSLFLLMLPRSYGLVPLDPRCSSCGSSSFHRLQKQSFHSFLGSSLDPSDVEVEEDDNDQWIEAQIAEVIQDDDDLEEELNWIPDREKANRMKMQQDIYHSRPQPEPISSMPTSTDSSDDNDNNQSDKQKASPYTEEEEELIQSMGGKTSADTSKREPGFLGDSTLEEIATDYSVPVCYLADVLCMWGVPVPISVQDRLGDLATGEQAFAILEAINSLDVAALHDRYSNQSLLNLCNDWEIDITEAFEMAMKEGWSLPFGVQTVLRVEQEDELLRVLGGYYPAE
ncbi:expressed unknown protein [Seminavis robusta]|uniref:Uncharacterized protein n=1 Tax=Seminavis robusta TaxID=568900 RepID=A0A9N8ECJ8_9STRA|nr:expressed unknown protein [Seminavis robusta]|eukprot:Sro756_g197790.1 n/a (325) ;mRNA; r:28573-29629